MNVGKVLSITDYSLDKKDLIHVAACYLEHKDKFLFLKRASNKPAGLTWGVPAGKIEANEAPHEALVRELYEETEVKIPIEEVLLKRSLLVEREDMSFVYHIFYSKASSLPKVNLNDEHTDYQWATFDEAISLNLVPGAEELFKILIESL